MSDGLVERRSGWRALGRVDDIPDGGTRAFGPAPGGLVGLFAFRRGEEVVVYLNACPHLGLPLDRPAGRFLSSDGGRIVCGNHAASFDPLTGVCGEGPCIGEALESVKIAVEGGILHVPENAGL